MDLVREAAGFEGLIVLAIIYFVLNALQKTGEKARRSRPSGPPPPEPSEPTPTQEEGFSLEGVLREIERFKAKQERETAPPAQRPGPAPLPRRSRPLPPARKAPPTMRGGATSTGRGPLGRTAPERLPSAEEVEERSTLEGVSLEVKESLEILDDARLRPVPVPIDRDDGVERVVEARIKAAGLRDQSHTEADHRSFHERMVQNPDLIKPVEGPIGRTRLRTAIIWREILGPPKAFEE